MFGFGDGLWDGQAVYYLLEYAPEWILCIIASMPLKGFLQGKLERARDENGSRTAVAVLVWWPKLAALFLLVLSYTELVTGSFNPFIYFRF